MNRMLYDIPATISLQYLLLNVEKRSVHPLQSLKEHFRQVDLSVGRFLQHSQQKVRLCIHHFRDFFSFLYITYIKYLTRSHIVSCQNVVSKICVLDYIFCMYFSAFQSDLQETISSFLIVLCIVHMLGHHHLSPVSLWIELDPLRQQVHHMLLEQGKA
jgi:hypothetical protein